MENQTRYDLNAAIESWRQELAAQAGLTAEVRRELETHLSDAIAGFRQRGLNDEESFWLARRRVGQPQQLGEEFVKADPAKVWRERVFWMVLVFFLMGTFHSVPWFIGILFFKPGPAENLPAEILVALLYLSPLIAAVLLGAGKMTRQFSKLIQLLDGRFRLASAALILILTSCVLQYFGQILFYLKAGVHQNTDSASFWQVLTEAAHLLVLACLLIWLVPTQNRKTRKRA